MLIGVALFLKFGCHGCDYIDGMLTGRAVAHKWFRDRNPIPPIADTLAALRQCEISWAIGFAFILFFLQVEQLNRRRYGGDLYKSQSFRSIEVEFQFQFQRLIYIWIGSDPYTRKTRNKAWASWLYLLEYAMAFIP